MSTRRVEVVASDVANFIHICILCCCAPLTRCDAVTLVQITKDTVDEGIHQLAQRKLKLDAAVLEGITGRSGDKARMCNSEAAEMGQLLQSLIAGTGTKQVMQENDPLNTTIVID